ncbi:cAMP-specific 3',5'-cyclic phosphodiesterase, isoform [Seminavis robusta]|uniref:cAMP-specific 3',5'-cyclic phosphodiesterase, isoform n=1 Tax=Seminavis robusta TaxID=568900 RepID=A0A9N8EQ67_9STRA|nr:cAMP-specific 3',5'-cyclic phosphodiesterase, isoform [Seminavis robusta]|eukprot:Sro1329_g263350.1 cAMP-specific 3',5'-cyclic phosphodiesterase, isoform (884) ;mRNA; f:21037-25201
MTSTPDAEANLPRRHSEPTLNGSAHEVAASEEANRRRQNRRRSSKRRLRDEDEASDGDLSDFDTSKVSLTWREIITGTLLVCAFSACMSVFVLLGGQQQQQDTDNTAVGALSPQCESKTYLQQNLLSYLIAGESHEDYLQHSSHNDDNSTCSYSFHICSDHPSTATLLDNLETVLYVLLLGALCTVMGVTVLVYDDSEDAMMQWIKDRSRRAAGKAMMDLSDHASWGGNASFRRNVASMADLFPDASVLFADIVGFEAWSSQREPTQCLTLLETIHDAFDRLAKEQAVFKVEASGSNYTAATGLPEARSDHAEALLRFADDCRRAFKETTKALEVTLGPDTSDLSLKVGIHSGPVTAIRGGRSRFQIMGDTVSTAASTCNSSKAGKIQLTHETVQLLPSLLQDEWVTVRNQSLGGGSGKGEENPTFWLTIPSDAEPSSNPEDHAQDDRIPRLVDWNVQILRRVLNQITAKRVAANVHYNGATGTASREPSPIPCSPVNEDAIEESLRRGKMVIDEVEEVIILPKYDAAVAKAQETLKYGGETIEVSDEVVDQLREYIGAIARSYKNNPFHNFEHASHVTMSVSKLLSRILRPKLAKGSSINDYDDDDKQQRIHDHTYGITSDPLTQFACMFSALIHDAEHDGVPNAQLVKEESKLASRYKNQSVAEQNSVDVGWNLLMEPRFQELRNAIYSNEAEMVHFRKLVVNCVMATDIVDKQLKELRNKRWERAFAGKTIDSMDISSDDPAILEEDVNRKATIVIEHLLQASDVSHTMQHFNVFRKWNEKLFHEMYFAFKDGRSTSDPSKFWYKGEIGFFDFYIIPLAKKLKECGVFGVSSDEYLNYATKNRQEWLSKGKGIVDGLVENAERAYSQIRDDRSNHSIKFA